MAKKYKKIKTAAHKKHINKTWIFWKFSSNIGKCKWKNREKKFNRETIPTMMCLIPAHGAYKQFRIEK